MFFFFFLAWVMHQIKQVCKLFIIRFFVSLHVLTNLLIFFWVHVLPNLFIFGLPTIDIPFNKLIIKSVFF